MELVDMMYILMDGDGKRIAESEDINEVLTPENLGIPKNALGKLIDGVKSYLGL